MMDKYSIPVSGLLGVATAIFSAAELPIPMGLGFLHLVNGMAVGAGYFIGGEFVQIERASYKRIFVIVFSCIVGTSAVIMYAISLYYSSPGLGSAILFTIYSFLSMFSISFVTGCLFRGSR
jgi:hypothetical protein